MKRDRFVLKPHGNKGRCPALTVLNGFSGVFDDYLKQRITNSEVIFDHLVPLGYKGIVPTIRRYIKTHKDLIPAERKAVSPQDNRGKRYETGPGECYQMDWDL